MIEALMTDDPIDLDKRRGMAAQKETELRRLVNEVAADHVRLKTRQDELEKHLVAAPARSWADATEKTRYLLSLFSTTAEAQDPRRKKLIANLLDDFERLLGAQDHKNADSNTTAGQ